MTRGEAKEFIAQSVKSDVDMALVADAIKALEQEPTTKNCRTCRNFGTRHGICEICKDNKCWTEKEPVLDKIIAEIKELQTYFHEMLILDEVMQIIDKYKAESES